MVKSIKRQDIGRFLREQLDYSIGNTAPIDTSTARFYKGVNRFLAACECEPLAPIALSDTQIEAFRVFIYDYSETLNPFSQAIESPEIDADWYYTQMQELSETADRFFTEKHIPMLSKGHAYPVGATGDDGPRLWKRSLSRLEDGSIQAEYSQVNTLDTSRPFLIGLSGTNQFHANQPLMRGFLKLMGKTIGSDEECIEKSMDCYLVSLPDAHRTRYQADHFALNAAPESHVGNVAQQLVDTILLPSLDITPNSSPEHMAEQLHHLNFFAYSYGSALAKEVRNGIRNRLSEMGFDAAEVKHGLAQAYALNIGPAVPLTPSEKGDFSSVYVASPNDVPIRSKVNMREYFAEPRDAIPLGENALFIRSQSPRQSLLVSDTEGSRASSNHTGHGIRSYSQRSAVIHDPTYVSSFLRYALQGKEGGLDARTADAPAMQLEAADSTATIPGKFVIAALSKAAENAVRPSDEQIER